MSQHAESEPTPSGNQGASPPGRANPASASGSRSAARPADRRRAFPQLHGQRGLATSAQLRDEGWTADALRHTRGRTTQLIFPRVYAPHLGPLTTEDRLVAAFLWAGEHAVLTGRVALERHGLNIASGGTCLFLVPTTHRARQTAGVATIRTTRAVTVATFRDCVPITDVARALCDAGVYQDLRGDELRATTIAVLQRRLTHPERLRAELAERPTNGLRPVFAALEEFSAGAWSLPEATLGRLVAGDAELPAYVMNVELRSLETDEFLGCPDGYFPSCGVALQVHSRAHHSGHDEQGRDRWSATVEKDSKLIEANVIVMPITPNSIDRQPERVLARIRRVVAKSSGRELPDVVVRQRGTSGQEASTDTT